VIFLSTVTAISTPNTAGGIAVIRMSGEEAISIADKVFRSGKRVDEMEGYTCAYGYVHDNGERIDDCILTVFRSPHSYTGEDVVEISCHGGIYVTKRILRTLLKNGAENAQAGEFTKRAFLNGKLDLTQAEGVMDIISAGGERELKMAESLREGSIFKKARECSGRLMKILGDLGAWADYPEEDIPSVEPENLRTELREISKELSLLVKNYDSGRVLREGISTAIIGRPNVGKSTLFNCLSGCERSIVTSIAGTTRDVVEESVRIGDIVLRLSDTAGIHETDDLIEGIGVDIAEKLIESSELIIAVFDGNSPLTEDDIYLMKRVKDKKCIAVINKSDLEQCIDVRELEEYIQRTVYLSAKEKDGVEKLQKAVEELFLINEETLMTVTVSNERQKRCIESSLACVDSAVEALNNGELLDAVNVIIDEAEQYLLELTGERVTEAVVDEVFSRFCVGK